jgi:hypothetical protein
MWRPLLFTCALAVIGCSSEPLPPGPGLPADVRSIRLFDDAGLERTNHVFLFRTDTLDRGVG